MADSPQILTPEQFRRKYGYSAPTQPQTPITLTPEQFTARYGNAFGKPSPTVTGKTGRIKSVADLAAGFTQPQAEAPARTNIPPSTFIQEIIDRTGVTKALPEEDSAGEPFLRGTKQAIGALGEATQIIPSILNLQPEFLRPPQHERVVSEIEAETKKASDDVKAWADKNIQARPATGKYARPAENFLDYLDPVRMYQTVGENAPLMAAFAGATIAHPAAGAALMFAVEGGSANEAMLEYEKKTGKKIPPIYRENIPVIIGAVNAALEKTGLENIFKVGKAAGLKRKLVKAALATIIEGGTEGAQEVTNILAETGYSGQIPADAGQRLVESIYAGLLLGAGGSTISALAGQPDKPSATPITPQATTTFQPQLATAAPEPPEGRQATLTPSPAPAAQFEQPSVEIEDQIRKTTEALRAAQEGGVATPELPTDQAAEGETPVRNEQPLAEPSSGQARPSELETSTDAQSADIDVEQVELRNRIAQQVFGQPFDQLPTPRKNRILKELQAAENARLRSEIKKAINPREQVAGEPEVPQAIKQASKPSPLPVERVSPPAPVQEQAKTEIVAPAASGEAAKKITQRGEATAKEYDRAVNIFDSVIAKQKGKPIAEQQRAVRAELESAGVNPVIVEELTNPQRAARPFEEETGARRDLTSREGRIRRAVDPPAQLKSKVDAIANAGKVMADAEASLDQAKGDIINEIESRGGEVVVNTDTGAFTIKLNIGKAKMGLPDMIALGNLRQEAAKAGAYSLATVGRGFEIAATPERIAKAKPLSGTFGEKVKEFIRRNQAAKSAQKEFAAAKKTAQGDLVDFYLSERAAGREPRSLKAVATDGTAVEVLTRRKSSSAKPDTPVAGRDFAAEIAKRKSEAEKRSDAIGPRGEPFLSTRKAGENAVEKAKQSGSYVAEPRPEDLPESARDQDKAIADLQKPYEPNYSKRPDASAKTDQLAKGAVESIGVNRRHGRVLLANAISAEAREKGTVNLIGKDVRTSDDVAALAQVYRDPRWETLRYIFVKDGKVVFVTGVSSRLPSSTAVYPFADSEQGMNWLRDLMANTDADNYWIVHNHPSGDVTPSKADIEMTSSLYSRVSGFKGHVIIDSNKYTTLAAESSGRKPFGIYFKDRKFGDAPVSSFGTHAEAKNFMERKGFDLDKYEISGTVKNVITAQKTETKFGEEKLLVPSKPHPILGLPLFDTGQVARLGAKYKAPEGWVTLISQGVGVRGIMEVRESEIENPFKSAAILRKFARQTGASDIFLVGEQTFVDKHRTKLSGAIKDGFLRDAVSTRGYSVREELRDAGKLPKDTNRKEFGISERRGREVREGGNILQKAAQKVQAKKGENPQIYTPEFKKWFGDFENDPQNASKVVGEDGRPLVVYHGTKSDFDSFEKQQTPRFPHENTDLGFFFVTNPERASSWAQPTGFEKTADAAPSVIPAYLSIKNPYIAESFFSLRDELKLKKASDIVDYLKDKGYDGIFFKHSLDKYLMNDNRWWIAFKDTQIKSAIGNRGTFSPTEPSIVRDNESGYSRQITEANEARQQRIEDAKSENKYFGDSIEKTVETQKRYDSNVGSSDKAGLMTEQDATQKYNMRECE